MKKRHFDMETDGFYGAYWKCKTDADCAMIAMIGDDSEDYLARTSVKWLQLLCNATRCILFQDEYGRIIIKANFANVIDPDDMEVTTNGNAWWSNARNVLQGNNNVYAELTRHFMRADGQQLFLPRNNDTKVEPTGYVTSIV